jgi:hypothetical protein
MIAMPDQFELPKHLRQRLDQGQKRAGSGSFAKRKGPLRDHLIRALWALLDGETLKALTGVQKSVLLCVAAWAEWGSGDVRLSKGSLSKHTGHDERACRRAVESLVVIGVLSVVREGSRGRGNASVYRIEKRGRSGSEKGAAPSLKGGAQTPTNKDDPRIIHGGAAGAAPPTGENALTGGTP